MIRLKGGCDGVSLEGGRCRRGPSTSPARSSGVPSLGLSEVAGCDEAWHRGEIGPTAGRGVPRPPGLHPRRPLERPGRLLVVGHPSVRPGPPRAPPRPADPRRGGDDAGRPGAPDDPRTSSALLGAVVLGESLPVLAHSPVGLGGPRRRALGLSDPGHAMARDRVAVPRGALGRPPSDPLVRLGLPSPAPAHPPIPFLRSRSEGLRGSRAAALRDRMRPSSAAPGQARSRHGAVMVHADILSRPWNHDPGGGVS